jgi:hypothetical protein
MGIRDSNCRDSASRGGTVRPSATGLLVATALSALTACGTPSAPVAPPVAQVSVTQADLIDNWGLASYRVDTDLVRTEAEAKRACSNPYVVSSGPSGGVMMHLADQATASEVFLKTASDGSVFIGPQGKPGDKRDRQVMNFAGGNMVTKWVDPDVATRYGTMVFVRCQAA